VLLTRNQTKLDLYFSDFSTIFYGIYKFLQNSHTIQGTNFSQAPGTFLDSYIRPCSTFKTSERSLPLQLGPPGRLPAGTVGFRRSGGRGRPGTGGGRPGGHLGSIPTLSRGGDGAGEAARRSQAAA
jgi:hypothetical protein